MIQFLSMLMSICWLIFDMTPLPVGAAQHGALLAAKVSRRGVPLHVLPGRQGHGRPSLDATSYRPIALTLFSSRPPDDTSASRPGSA